MAPLNFGLILGMMNSSHEQTSMSLLERARADDPTAWERLVSLYSPLVYQWCRRWRLQPDDAENVAQEVFTAVSAGLHAFRKNEAAHSFRGWLRTIAHHKFVDHVRQSSSEPNAFGGNDANEMIQSVPFEDDEQSISAETKYLHQRAVELIKSHFKVLDWEAFERIVVRNESPKDVAESLSITVNSVYLAKSRILRRLREEFSDIIEGIEEDDVDKP